MYFIVVKKNELARFDELHRLFGQRMSVIWDRRKRNRRSNLGTTASGERRVRDRRGPVPTIWKALGFTVAEGKV